MRPRAALLIGLLGCLTLGGCGAAEASPPVTLTPTASPVVTTSTTPTPEPEPSRTATVEPEPEPEPDPEPEPEPEPLTAVSAWDACQEAWEVDGPSIDWDGWDEFRTQNAADNGDRGWYVARYKINEAGTAAVDVRDCLVSGTADDSDVELSPPLSLN